MEEGEEENDDPQTKKRQFKQYKKSGSLVMQCEWGSCQEVFTLFKHFVEHIDVHLGQLDTENIDELSCFWRDCSHELSGLSEMLRHTYYHAYHTKLKATGASLIQCNNLDHCKIDSGNRNVIPHLPERFVCGLEICGEGFDNPDEFYKHVQVHIAQYPEASTNGWLCYWQECQDSFGDKYKLSNHLRSHTQEKVVACPTCGSLFTCNKKLNQHLRRQNFENCEFQCSHCNKPFPSAEILKDHMQKHVHKYKCPFCEMTSSTPCNLKAHVSSRHMGSDVYVCDKCNKQYKSFRSLKRHFDHCKKVDSQQEFYVCPESKCNFRTAYDFKMTQHVKNQHSTSKQLFYLCHICEKKYTRGHKLTRHLQAKHGVAAVPGQCKFMYKLGDDGFYRLQTDRYESYELVEVRKQRETASDQPQETTSETCSNVSEVSMSYCMQDTIEDTPTSPYVTEPCLEQPQNCEQTAHFFTVDAEQLAQGVQFMNDGGRLQIIPANVVELGTYVQEDDSGQLTLKQRHHEDVFNLEVLDRRAAAATPTQDEEQNDDEPEAMVIDRSFLEISAPNTPC